MNCRSESRAPIAHYKTVRCELRDLNFPTVAITYRRPLWDRLAKP
jgi:hypothetical protein